MSNDEIFEIAKVSDWTIHVEHGVKSEFDFRVRYRKQGQRVRTPMHIHLVVDLYAKQGGNRPLAKELINHMLSVMGRLQPITSFPPALQVYQPGDAKQFEALDAFGEYPVDFLLIVFELIMIQEATNYPTGTLNKKLFELLHRDADIFSVVSAATFRGT